ncbi:hypothetical protein J5834_06650 [bacterium]|nr:hypothetical protein [bacterium]
MEDPQSEITAALDSSEREALQNFKKECFYLSGGNIKNHDFWQQFFNMFFIRHYAVENGETPAKKRGLADSRIRLFAPSFFTATTGKDFFTDEKLQLVSEEEHGLSWYGGHDFILSFFHADGQDLSFTDVQSSLLISSKASSFFKMLKKELSEKSAFGSNTSYLLMLIAILMLKKECFSDLKLYNPYQMTEIEKLDNYYKKFASNII